jgi:phage baseplate assembly protein W
MATKTLNIDSSVYFSDFSFDFTPHPKTGDITVLKNDNSIKNSVKNIILTKYGEILFDSSFGCGLHNSLFDLMDGVTKYAMKDQIKNALKNFESRVQVVSVDIVDSTRDNGYDINLQYTIINTYEVQTITVFLEKIR